MKRTALMGAIRYPPVMSPPVLALRFTLAAALAHAAAALVFAGCDSDPSASSSAPSTTETGDRVAQEGAASAGDEPAATAPVPDPAAGAEDGARDEPSPPLRCVELDGDIPVFAGRVRGRRITLGRLIQGPRPDDHEPELRVEATVEVNDDGQDDLIASPLFDGESGCGNRGECVQGLFVGCLPDAFAIMIRPDYFTSLEILESTTTYGERPWREVRQVLRVAGDMEEEVERLEAGEPLTADVIWWRADGGYTSGRPFGGKWSDQCLHHLQQERHAAARAACELGLRAASRPRERGALLYNLGRVAEAQGDAAAAGDFYRRSLQARPGNATVQQRLESLTANGDAP